MSDRMHPIPFEQLLNWTFEELKAENSIFGCSKFYKADPADARPYMGRYLETALGPAAGPHTQLAQNIVASYVSGARLFELKTVQIIDGEDLPVSKPCILAEDEGYNCEWSTELTVPQAQNEYIKAWMLLHVLARELELGAQDGFVFNMSVGYNLEGIQSPKIDSFLNNMKDASNTEEFLRCKENLASRLDQFKHFTKEDLDAISPNICNSITVSTMHGCPPSESEKIVMYLMEEKGLNLLLKCNPTLVGYDYARAALDKLGFDYIHFEQDSFDHDLQYADAVPLLTRVRARAAELGLYFGVKLTNTFHVKATKGELPDENMYMSGRTLLPLSLKVGAMISEAFEGKLPISYCGGVDAKNIAAIRASGIYPITVCTELLKPGGYGKLVAMADALKGTADAPCCPEAARLSALADSLCAPARAKHDVRRSPRPDTVEAKANCRVVCGACSSVCPNRANVVIMVNGAKQMLHIDGMCNECGNCASFCAEKTAPYLEKMTVFCTEGELNNSKNWGFAPADEAGNYAVRWNGTVSVCALEDAALPAELRPVIQSVTENYPWLLYK